MIASSLIFRNERQCPERISVEPHWYATYTCSHHEKKVAEQLVVRDVETFLPLFRARHRWKDRYMNVELPLFPGYVFVRLPLSERLRVLEISSVVRFVTCAGAPVPLPDDQIAAIRQAMFNQLKVQPYPYIRVGAHVRVHSGPLQGMQGTVIREKGGTRFVLSIELIMRSIAIEVDAADLEQLPSIDDRRYSSATAA